MNEREMLDALDYVAEYGTEMTDVRVRLFADALARLIRAVDTLSVYLVQAQTGFNHHDMQVIQRILNGEIDPKGKENG